jgi:polyhydroxyalkanoate synthesis regulator phasin
LNIALPNIDRLTVCSEQPGSIEITPDVNLVICGLGEIENSFNKILGEIEKSVKFIRGEIEKSGKLIREGIEQLKNILIHRSLTKQETKALQERIEELEAKVSKLKNKNRKNEEAIAKLESELLPQLKK